MPCAYVKKITSIFLVVMIFAASALCFCQETHAAEQAWESNTHEAAAVSLEPSADHCPACPGGGPAEKDHCSSSCYCSCHLPVSEQPLQIRHSSIVADLISFESFTALPEVYLAKFIPPQNQA